MSSVVDRHSGRSWPKEELERRGLRRRGMGRAIGVGAWDGMAVRVEGVGLK
jgi:hypothetical protein